MVDIARKREVTGVDVREDDVAVSVTAIMVLGEPHSAYHLIQADDRNGIIHMYGAYP